MRLSPAAAVWACCALTACTAPLTNSDEPAPTADPPTDPPMEPPPVAAPSGVAKYAADDLGTGWYDNQPLLAPAIVAGPTFGQLFKVPVVGQVYAQPLVANGILFIVTEDNNVYGLDPDTGQPKWPSINIGSPFLSSDIGCADLTPHIGITGTPVIDMAEGVAYFFAKSYVSGSSGQVRFQMHGINVATGQEKPGFPVTIAGNASNEPSLAFEPRHHHQRPGLLLQNGVVYASFGSHCDIGPYQGWIVAVGTNGAIRSLWSTEAGPSRGAGAAIWQSGSGLVSDGPGRIFFASGNGGAVVGPIGGKTPPPILAEAVVHVDVQGDGTLEATDFFSPFNARSGLDPADADFGSGGPTALPPSLFGTASHPNILVVVGKEGFVYLLDRDNLGGIGNGPGGSDNVVARVGPNGGVWSKPSVWGGDGGYVYIIANGGPMFAYKYGVTGTGDPTLSVAGMSPDKFGFSSGAPIVTSSGSASGSALVWTIWSSGGSGTGGQLRAYDAVPGGDGKLVLRFSAPVGTVSKFAPPGVGAGRIYVGARDGNVYGFGAPVSMAVTAPATSFGSVVIGASETQTVTVTAQRATVVTGFSTTSSQFTLGAPSRALPASLAAGDTITVPVTFSPTATGPIGASFNSATQADGVALAALSGTGQAATAELSADKVIASFGGIAVGGTLTSSVTLSNTGSQSLTITGVTPLAAPFSATGLPATGTVLAAGASLTVLLEFSPIATGEFNDSLAVRSTGGNVSVALSGNSLTTGNLIVSALAGDAGDVALGASRVVSFTVTNTGGSDVTITKSKPPVLGPFVAVTALDEGSKIHSGQTVIETVVFTPAAEGAARDSWVINGDDASGLKTIMLFGGGVAGAPSLTAGGFVASGNAAISGGEAVLTTTAPNVAGSVFWPNAFPAEGLTISFDAMLSGGSGADGIALVLADPAQGATSHSLGATGGGLGYSGIPGIAVGLDTFQNVRDPSSNFVGIATSGQGDAITWAATTTAVPDFRATVRHVTVTVRGGTVTVFVDGLQVLSRAVAVPSRVLVGFTAATGGLTDRHAVSNLSITGFTAHVNFQPAGASVLAPYLVDDGSVFGARPGGLSYGWSGDNRDNARQRNDATSPDPRFDTLLHMQKPSLPDASWELAVPNGTYQVRLVAGDPQTIDSVYQINAEGVLVVSGTPSSTTHWFTGTSTVVVSDGRLTLKNAAGATNNKVCFIDVMLQTP
ncbi:MAG TPA: choice-of-anchor D domain-containing protein [Kofleriaceae bacterium]